MKTAVAQIRTPTDDELNEFRRLWIALGRQLLPPSTSACDELQAYLHNASYMVGLIAGVDTRSGAMHWENEFPTTVSTDGVERLRDSALLWARVLSLWTPIDSSHR